MELRKRNSHNSLIMDRLRESIDVKQSVLGSGELLALIGTVGAACTRALEQGGKLFFFGNGGSAADAQHLAAELAGRYLRERPSLPALALTTNSSCLTAIANDYSYDQVFSRQLEGLGAPGDVAVGISTSGNSPNVLSALQCAKAKNMVTVAMTGKSGGKLKAVVTYCLRVPSEETPRIQEAHILIGHILCEIIETNLADKSHPS